MSSVVFLRSLGGGALIGAASLALLLFNGRIAGISGVMAGLISPRTTTHRWRAAFLIGLLIGGVLAFAISPAAIGAPVVHSPFVWAAGGILAGLGARLAGGCTSGHGVCGIGRLSPRSLVATLTFMTTGAATVLAVRLLGGLA
jgi:uncharacterized protein